MLVDSNVVLDLVTNDPVWGDWSNARIDEALSAGPLYVTDVVYAELAVRYERVDELDDMLAGVGVQLARTPRAALHVAAQAFGRFLASGGRRTSVIPDFFIGAHAAVENWPLLTRDPKPFRRYFPDVRLITPPAHP
ncbi:type II toxin-antitoxin system VapC family toxin [Salinarimonas sp.]|uniref:type II toxin-antitoxin system VapC family toxin n=1 Tax=Salinarimonas sp. TaxID=2766526 RepID=UPI0032D91F1E